MQTVAHRDKISAVTRTERCRRMEAKRSSPILASSKSPMRYVARGKLRDDIEPQIIEAYLNGRLSPDNDYAVSDLAAAFRVSRTPIREVLANLSRLGFMEASPHRGFRLRRVGWGENHDLERVRLLLELPAMISLAGSLRDSKCTELEDIAKVSVGVAKARDLEELVRSEMIFEAKLFQCLSNRQLASHILRVRLALAPARIRMLTRWPDRVARSQDQLKLVEAIAAGRVKEVRQIIEKCQTCAVNASRSCSDTTRFGTRLGC